MKRVLMICLVLIVGLSFCSCKETGNRTKQNNTKTVADILSEANGENDSTASSEKTEAVKKDTTSVKADIDLTTMSSTMVYAEVSNMITNPDDYIGKTVKMNGNFSVYEGETRNYFACIIADATACCSQGIEFVLSDGRKYPDEYPKPGAEITVVGKFETYYEEKLMYCQLVNAEMV